MFTPFITHTSHTDLLIFLAMQMWSIYYQVTQGTLCILLWGNMLSLMTTLLKTLKSACFFPFSLMLIFLFLVPKDTSNEYSWSMGLSIATRSIEKYMRSIHHRNILCLVLSSWAGSFGFTDSEDSKLYSLLWSVQFCLFHTWSVHSMSNDGCPGQKKIMVALLPVSFYHMVSWMFWV